MRGRVSNSHWWKCQEAYAMTFWQDEDNDIYFNIDSNVCFEILPTRYGLLC